MRLTYIFDTIGQGVSHFEAVDDGYSLKDCK